MSWGKKMTTPPPTHTDTEGTAVLFLGWTTTDNHEKIYDAGEQLPTLVSEVNIPAVATVYAVWAYDRNGDGTPRRPADHDPARRYHHLHRRQQL